MQIIFGKQVAEELRKNHTVLELESFDVGGVMMPAYCVLMPESITVSEMPDLDRLCRLHQALVDALNRKDYATVTHGIEHLKGKFSGELDSFYSVLEERIASSQNTQ